MRIGRGSSGMGKFYPDSICRKSGIPLMDDRGQNPDSMVNGADNISGSDTNVDSHDESVHLDIHT